MSSVRGDGAGARRVREDVHLRDPGVLDRAQRMRERGLVLRREADDHVARQVELARERRKAPKVRARRIAALHRAQHAVVSGLERHVQVARQRRRLAQRGDEVVVDVVDLDRAESQPLEPRRRAGFAHEPRQVEAGRPVAEAAEVDAGQDDLAVPLRDTPANLREYRLALRLRDAPRTSGITQKLHENEHPSWIFTNARTRPTRASACTHPIAPTSPATKAAVSSLRLATTVTFAGNPANGSPAGSRRSRSRTRAGASARRAPRPDGSSRLPRS